MPTTLVGQVDAAIGGKTAIDLPEGKNLVGAFHWPARTVIDPALLATLPEAERRNGMAEVVKTGCSPASRSGSCPTTSSCAAAPRSRPRSASAIRTTAAARRCLNLGHTFAHALEAARRLRAPHGSAVALGLLAALRLSGRATDRVEEVLAPRPVQVDRERAWEALRRDKKAGGGCGSCCSARRAAIGRRAARKPTCARPSTQLIAG